MSEPLPKKTAMADLDKLKELAKAATPGPWEHYRSVDARPHQVAGPTAWRPIGAKTAVIADIPRYGYEAPEATAEQDANAAFIAAANPATVLELIALARRDGGSDAGGGDEFMVGPRGGMESRTTPADPRPDPTFLGHLIVPNSGVGAVFIDKGQPIPLMGNKGHVIPVYDGPQNVTADPLEALREAREVIKTALLVLANLPDSTVEGMHKNTRKDLVMATDGCRQALAKINEVMGEAG